MASDVIYVVQDQEAILTYAGKTLMFSIMVLKYWKLE